MRLAAPSGLRALAWPPASRLLAAGLAAVLLALWLAGLGLAPLFDVDEGAFAEASREMLASGDWWHTTLNGADRFDKPILVYWLQAASLWLLGSTEFAVRLPSALCAWAWCLATAAFVAPRWGRPAAVASAVVLATSLGPLLIGRAATADALLNLLIALTLFDLWRGLEGGDAPTGQPGGLSAGRGAWRRAWVWAGLGLLAKGPVAVVVPAGALLLWAALQGRPTWRRLWQAGRDWRGPLIALAIALPWYAYALHRHGQAFVDGFFLRHNLQRFSGPLEGHGGSAFYHLLLLPLLLLPWTPLLLPLLRQWRRWWQAPAGRFLLAWALFVLGFFSLSGTKLPHYMLYGITPLAVLLGCVLCSGTRAAGLAVLACCAGLAALGAASPWLLAGAVHRWGDGFWRAMVAGPGLPPGPDLGAAALVGLLLLAAAVWLWRQPRQTAAAALVAALGVAQWCSLQVLPWWGQALQGPTKALALQAAAQGGHLVQWQLHQPSAGFYRGQPVPRRAPQAGELALTRVDRLLPGAQVLQQQGALALVAQPAGVAP